MVPPGLAGKHWKALGRAGNTPSSPMAFTQPLVCSSKQRGELMGHGFKGMSHPAQVAPVVSEMSHKSGIRAGGKDPALRNVQGCGIRAGVKDPALRNAQG